MFWLYLRNHMHGAHEYAEDHFAWLITCGLLAPGGYLLVRPFLQIIISRVRRDDLYCEEFEDCVDAPALLSGMSGNGSGLRSELFGELLTRSNSTLDGDRPSARKLQI